MANSQLEVSEHLRLRDDCNDRIRLLSHFHQSSIGKGMLAISEEEESTAQALGSTVIREVPDVAFGEGC